jgi:cell division protein FtsB
MCDRWVLEDLESEVRELKYDLDKERGANRELAERNAQLEQEVYRWRRDYEAMSQRAGY